MHSPAWVQGRERHVGAISNRMVKLATLLYICSLLLEACLTSTKARVRGRTCCEAGVRVHRKNLRLCNTFLHSRVCRKISRSNFRLGLESTRNSIGMTAPSQHWGTLRNPHEEVWIIRRPNSVAPAATFEAGFVHLFPLSTAQLTACTLMLIFSIYQARGGRGPLGATNSGSCPRFSSRVVFILLLIVSFFLFYFNRPRLLNFVEQTSHLSIPSISILTEEYCQPSSFYRACWELRSLGCQNQDLGPASISAR